MANIFKLDQVVSKKKALSNAKSELAASVKTLVESVTDKYVKSSEMNNLEQVEERFEALNREVIKQELVGIKTMCEKLTKTTEGKFKTYIAIELSAQKYLDKFYKDLGFYKTGEDYLEDGIPHQRMLFDLV